MPRDRDMIPMDEVRSAALTVLLTVTLVLALLTGSGVVLAMLGKGSHSGCEAEAGRVALARNL